MCGFAVNWIVELGPVWLRSVAGFAEWLLLLRGTLASLSMAHLGAQKPREEAGKRKHPGLAVKE